MASLSVMVTREKRLIDEISENIGQGTPIRKGDWILDIYTMLRKLSVHDIDVMLLVIRQSSHNSSISLIIKSP